MGTRSLVCCVVTGYGGSASQGRRHRGQGELRTREGSPHFKPPLCRTLRCQDNRDTKVTPTGTEETAQVGKRVLSKRKDLGSDPGTGMKSLKWLAHV